MNNSFGWTVIRNTTISDKGQTCPFFVYRRDCPPDAAHFAQDLAEFTHETEPAAIAAGKRGDYAYKR